MNWRKTDHRLAAAAILLVCGLYLYGLDSNELTNKDEARSGTIVRDMAEGGHWLLPRTPDGYYSEKPVLYYGLCALLGPALGIHEGSLRGVSALMALAALGLTWVLARLYGPPSAAWIAAAALASNLLILRSGRSATVDMTLTLFITAGLTAYLAARREKLQPYGAALLCGVCFGLATLSKGPIGAVLPAVVLVGLQLIETRGRFWRGPWHWGPLLTAVGICLGIALSWYVPAYLRGGREFLQTSLLSENFYMPLGAPQGLGVGHPKPLSFYPLQQALAFIAVAPLLPLVALWFRETGAAPARTQLGVWFGAGLLLLMVAANKRSYYLMPLQPAVAAAIGLASAAWLERSPPAVLRRGCAAFGAALLLASGWGLILVWFPAARPAQASEAARRMLELGHVPLALFSGLGLALGAWFVASSLRGTRAMVLAVIGMAYLALAGRTLAYEPVLGQLDHTRPFVKEMLARLPRGTRPLLLTAAPGYALDFYWPDSLIRDPSQAESAQWLFVGFDRLSLVRGPFEVLGVWRFPDPAQDLALVWRKLP